MEKKDGRSTLYSLLEGFNKWRICIISTSCFGKERKRRNRMISSLNNYSNLSFFLDFFSFIAIYLYFFMIYIFTREQQPKHIERWRSTLYTRKRSKNCKIILYRHHNHPSKSFNLWWISYLFITSFSLSLNSSPCHPCNVCVHKQTENSKFLLKNHNWEMWAIWWGWWWWFMSRQHEMRHQVMIIIRPTRRWKIITFVRHWIHQNFIQCQELICIK